MTAIILDIGNDEGLKGISTLNNMGALPICAGKMIKQMAGAALGKPLYYGWEENKSFPESSPLHAILNYLYATAQQAVVPPEVLGNMRNRVEGILDALGATDINRKNIIKGSRKQFTKIYPNGVEVTLTVTKPAHEERGVLASLDDIVEKEKEKHFVEHYSEDPGIDLVKLRNWIESIPIDSDVRLDLLKGLYVLNRASRKKASFKDFPNKITEVAKKISEVTGVAFKDVVRKIAFIKGTPDSTVFNGVEVDTHKLAQYPFDAYNTAEKTLTPVIAGMICNTRGNIKLAALQTLADQAPQEPIMSKILDRVVSYIKKD